MWFEINNNNEFVENSEGSIKIDGMLSDEEKQELQDAFECNCSEIKDETDWRLAELLHRDIIPHLENSDLSQDTQTQILQLSEKHPYEVINLWITIPEDLEATLSQEWLDLSIARAIWDIESYISRELQLPVDSNISSQEYNAIIWTVGWLIQNNIQTVAEIVEDTKNENPNLSTRELTWIINSKISANFDDMRAHIISPLQLYLKYSSQSEQENLDILMREEAERAYVSQRHPNPDAPVNRTVDQMVESRYNTLKQDHRGFTRTMNDSFIRWNIENINELSTIDTYMWVLWTEYYQTQKEVKDNLDVSLLNEADKEIEWKAMLYFLCAVWVQCLPYVWAAPWVVADATDIFSSQDATMMWLKEMWLVPDEYNIEKTWVDSILAWAWIVLSVVWLQALAKSWKLAKALQWIKNLTPDMISDSLSLFTSRMWFGDETDDALKWLMWVEEVLPNAPNPRSINTGDEGSNFQDMIDNMPEILDTFTRSDWRIIQSWELFQIDGELYKINWIYWDWNVNYEKVNWWWLWPILKAEDFPDEYIVELPARPREYNGNETIRYNRPEDTITWNISIPQWITQKVNIEGSEVSIEHTDSWAYFIDSGTSVSVLRVWDIVVEWDYIFKIDNGTLTYRKIERVTIDLGIIGNSKPEELAIRALDNSSRSAQTFPDVLRANLEELVPEVLSRWKNITIWRYEAISNNLDEIIRRLPSNVTWSTDRIHDGDTWPFLFQDISDIQKQEGGYLVTNGNGQQVEVNGHELIQILIQWCKNPELNAIVESFEKVTISNVEFNGIKYFITDTSWNVHKLYFSDIMENIRNWNLENTPGVQKAREAHRLLHDVQINRAEEARRERRTQELNLDEEHLNNHNNSMLRQFNLHIDRIKARLWDKASWRIDDIMEIFGDNIHVSNIDTITAQKWLEHISRIDEWLLRVLVSKWVKIRIWFADVKWLTRSDFVNHGPRWWNQNDWSNVQWVYSPSSKTAYAWTWNSWSSSTMLHELWHAVWDALGWDITKELHEAHIRLYDKLISYLRQWWKWGEAWKQELFAESFSDFHMIPKGKFIRKYDLEWYEYMKRSIENNFNI